MPWRRESPMDQKIKLLGDWLSGDYNKSALSRIYGVTRPTVDKWIARYAEQGLQGLEERSRAALSHPNETPTWIAQTLIDAKLKHQDWGPRKLVRVLQQAKPDVAWPAPSTAGELLKREGLVKPRKRRRTVPPYTEPFRHCSYPNRVWSIDYKGQFRTGDGRYCYPLTVTDNMSRYLLTCRGLRHPTLAATKPWLEVAFREYGLPEAIRSDNGTPFASTGLGGLSSLSVWWIRLGIVPERIEPGRPDQNGRHERMHKTLKGSVITPPAATLRQQQQAFERFRREFNELRPHEALDMDTPASRYRPSARSYPEKLPEVEYSGDCPVRRVRSNGEIKWRGELVYTSQALIGEPIELKESLKGGWDVYFHTYRLGHLHREGGPIRPPKV